MLLKDLIQTLQVLYNRYDDEYKQIAGEPEIMIDQFALTGKEPHTFFYAGFDKDIAIEQSSDGVYLIINRFVNDDTRPNN